MKCRKCGQKAVINMRQHKLALCKEHYLEWIPQQTQRFIEKYRMFTPEDRILVAVSGGKDSLALWDILHRLGYQADGLYIGLGIDGGIGYSAESLRCCQNFAQQHGLKLRVVDLKSEFGHTIPELAQKSARGRGKPCSVCGLSKRNIMNRVAREEGYTVLVTGHNLDDEAAVLFGNTLNWLGGYLRRQSPVLEASHPGLVRKAKPLCRFYEREMAAYALLRGIEYIYDECPHAVGAKTIYYKEVLNRLEAERPGAKLRFYLSFLQAKEEGLFAPPEKETQELTSCVSCGQPTTAGELCSFCRMVEKDYAVSR
ncbi:MAG: adenine nucleotide alpha hydrolase family protein [Anaerolineae bacterium]|nr:MAG: adenine nucleotide alpha hydrolase family protein [Anaerolineae bacterium]